MMNIEMCEFVPGAADFMSYWLPLIAFMGTTEETSHTAYVMLFKYRTAFVTKESAKVAARQELAEIFLAVADIEDLTLKTTKIIELAKTYHYYPTPEYFLEWKKEWDLNGLNVPGAKSELH